MNYSGLYSPFKLNRPLNEEDIKYQLRQDFSGMGSSNSVALDDTIVIRMNSTYLELVDKYYSDRGMPDVFAFILTFSPFIAAIFTLYQFIVEIQEPVPSLFGLFVCLLMPIILMICSGFCYKKLLRKSWFTWTHYPVRFNRKTKMVHVFKLDGSTLSVPWKDIFFTRGRAGQGAMPEWSIDGHILADDQKRVIDTFSLGFSNTRRELVKNWAFVRSYMEVDDCLNELADIIVLCPPIADKKESYLFGLQYIIRVESRLEWVFRIILSPLILLGSFARFIAMRTSKIPRWSKEVEENCRVDPDDPINVSGENNPKHIWRYVLANQLLDEYNAQYQRQTDAMKRLRIKVQATTRSEK
ncbi:DUF6708 domain-containing protein [Yersinia pseudotuberculosis]|uniref:DUF6708 domain-containing protein n=1 Tax=Yersinia pseudotuberculosis TaxID=633 RepID=UPI0005E21BD2|nr:DUF6708 domain-containing protein [Yersinia pseudotuberculosis]CNE41256.1 Uncharacterised protein [Yersinia pseudotuberculosis]